MPRLSSFVLIAAAAIAALLAFRIAEQTQEMEARLRLLQRDIAAERELIHVARAEWSYLTRPARISDLARRHLSFMPLEGKRFINSETLGQRQDLLLAEYNAAFTLKDPGP